jgi:hypothetical protein
VRIERDDIAPDVYEVITAMLFERLLPLLSSNGTSAGDDTLMTVDETAKFLNLYKKDGKVNREQIYQWVNNAQHGLGDFPYLKAGKLLRFSRKAILNWLESR